MQPKPPFGAVLNRSHPLARGVVGYWPLTEVGASSVLDLASGLVGAVPSTVLWTSTPYGPGLLFPGSGSAWITGTGLPLTSGPWSTVTRYFITADINNNYFAQLGSVSSTRQLVHLNDAFSQLTNVNLFSDDHFYSWPSKQLSRWHTIVATMDSVNAVRLYLDGVLLGSQAAGGNVTLTSTWAFGGSPFASVTFSGTIAMHAVYNRALSAEDVLWYQYDPFAVLERPTKIWLVSLTAGGGTIYTDTGSATSVEVGSGADALTASDAGTATSALVGSGADAATFSDAGQARSVFTGSGADVLIVADTGAATSILTGSGTDAPTFSDMGVGLAALFGSGTDTAILVDNGTGVLTAIGSGSDTQPGTAIIGACAALAQQAKPLGVFTQQAKPRATLAPALRVATLTQRAKPRAILTQHTKPQAAMTQRAC